MPLRGTKACRAPRRSEAAAEHLLACSSTVECCVQGGQVGSGRCSGGGNRAASKSRSELCVGYDRIDRLLPAVPGPKGLHRIAFSTGQPAAVIVVIFRAGGARRPR